MKTSSLKGAIVLVAHNRPEELQRVLASIKSSKRQVINELIIALQIGNQEVENLCYEIDWIHTRILEKRHASESIKKRINQNVFAGIKAAFDDPVNDWVVVIEDDIVVAEDFFRFISEIMERFYADKNFFGVNGFSGLPRQNDTSSQFGRYRYGFGWGWALHREKWLSLNQYWSGQEDFHWDQLIEPIVKTGFVVMPLQSRILNIGFNERASHTHKKKQDIHPQEKKLIDSFVQLNPTQPYEEKSLDLKWRNDCRVYFNSPKLLSLIVSKIYKIKKIYRIGPEDIQLNRQFRAKINGILDLALDIIYTMCRLKSR